MAVWREGDPGPVRVDRDRRPVLAVLPAAVRVGSAPAPRPAGGLFLLPSDAGSFVVDWEIPPSPDSH